jgi:hypothetical protein
MSEPLSSLKEGYIYIDHPNPTISELWVYLGVFNCLTAISFDKSKRLCKCEIKKNKPWFMDYEQRNLVMTAGTLFPHEIKPIGCTLEDINTLVESSKEKFRDLYSIHSSRHFELVVSNYIRIMTLSKGNIKIPSNFEIVSSDNNNLILRAPNSINSIN